MNKFLIVTAATVATIMVGAGAATVSAQDKEATLKSRQDIIKAQSADLRVVKAYIDGTGDQAAALEKANDLVAVSGKFAPMFIAGTSSKDLPGKSAAKPEIWAEKAKFDAAATALHTEAEKLAAAVKSGDKTAVDAAFKAVGGACGNCHNPFREKTS